MPDNDLVFSSTTDTPEQIREGLGLPAVEPGAETPAAEGAEAAAPASEPPSAVLETKPAAVAEPKGAPATPAKKPVAAKPAPTQKELDRVAAAARRDAEAKNAILEAEVQALRERLDSTLAPPTQPDGKPLPPDPGIRASFDQDRAKLGPKPKQEDFEDYKTFEDKRDEWIEARATLRAKEELAQATAARQTAVATQDAQRTWNATLANYQVRVKDAREKYKDYDTVAKAADASDLRAANHVKFAVLSAGEDVGELQYHLMKHPAVLDRLNSLSPARAAVEIGRLAATLSTGGRPAAPRPRPISHAPEPQGTELGTLSSALTDDLEQAPDQRTYNRIREKQRQQRGLGR